METQPAEKKRGRYVCPACGERIKKPVKKGAFFGPIYHCSSCGIRVHINPVDLYMRIGTAALTLNVVLAILFTLDYPIRWENPISWNSHPVLLIGLAIVTLLNLYSLLRASAKDDFYRLKPDGSEKAASRK